MADSTDREELSRLARETYDLREGITNITLAWANIENAAVMLLASIFREQSAALSSAVYFSMTGLDARLNAIDAAFRTLIAGHRFEPQISEGWNTFTNRMKRMKTTRNKVAHGQIVTVFHHGKNHARLSSPVFDFRRAAAAHAKRQLPGLSASDLRGAIEGASKAVDLIWVFDAMIDPIYQNDVPALQQKLAELAMLLHHPNNPDTQSPPTASLPPRSSRG